MEYLPLISFYKHEYEQKGDAGLVTGFSKKLIIDVNYNIK